MADKESAKRKAEIKQVFAEVLQIAWAGASPIMREALEKYRVKFEELTERKKKGADSTLTQLDRE